MSLAIKQLTKWQLPGTPVNYAVSYEYVANKNAELRADIQRQLQTDKRLDDFFIEEIYKQYILGQNKFREEIITDLGNVLGHVENNCKQSSASAQVFINQLDNNISDLQSVNANKRTVAVSQLRQASSTFKSKQQSLVEQLQLSQKHTRALQNELDEVSKEIYCDPITGLYNRKAMSKHIDTWLSQDPNKKIAMIVVNINHFPQFNQRFGALLGDVILSKVANKISSYVNKSGLPVRTSGDEFLILLPDVEASSASEIGEKIRTGVEKLRFVSVQTGIRLPQMKISLGISEMKAKEPFNHCIQRAREALVAL